MLPISLVLATLRDRYIAGLTAFRHMSETASSGASAATNEWLWTFVEAAAIAVEQSEGLVDNLEALRQVWIERLTTHRIAVGLRPAPRADSAVARLLGQLPEAPVVTARTLARILDVSFPAASSALDELERAGILTTKSIERGGRAYVAREVLDVGTLSERSLASTRFDTRASPPNRGVAALPLQ